MKRIECGILVFVVIAVSCKRGAGRAVAHLAPGVATVGTEKVVVREP